MTFLEIVKKVAADAHVTQDKARSVIDCVVDAIKDDLQADGKATIMGLGSLKVVTRTARKGRNPKTGEIIDIPGHKAISFKPSRGLIESIQ